MVTGLGFNGITEMQQMTSDVCKSAIPGLEGRLKDTRDDKVYWIGKLKDYNCWMTQNLNYDGGGTRVSSSFSKNYSAEYYNPGEYTYKDATKTPINSMMLTYNPDSTWSITDDTGFYAATTYISSDDKVLCTKKANSYFGDMVSNYIPCRLYSPKYLDDVGMHYLIGNYYNYKAVINSDDSICPLGWNVPTGGEESGDFHYLLGDITSANIVNSPYYYVYGGYVKIGTKISEGSVGYYWSSTPFNSNRSYSLSVQNNSINTSANINDGDGVNYYLGMSVRCVAR